jgi:hypothetical protein
MAKLQQSLLDALVFLHRYFRPAAFPDMLNSQTTVRKPKLKALGPKKAEDLLWT